MRYQIQNLNNLEINQLNFDLVIIKYKQFIKIQFKGNNDKELKMIKSYKI